VIPLDKIERDTYKFVWGLKIRVLHPYFTQISIENDDKEFLCLYKGMTLNGEPCGLGKLKLYQRDEEEDDEDEERSE
jgi:hypothetical protein